MKVKKRIIFTEIIKNTFLWKAFCGYLVFFAAISVTMLIFEPSIRTLGDALWYAFASATTIGFGDFVATSLLSRVLTVALYIYTVLIVALITAVFTQFFIEIAKAKRNNSISIMQHDLEHLAELPKERLEEISQKIRRLHSK